MTELSYEQLIELIGKHFNEADGDKDEERIILDQYTEKVDFLQIHYQILQNLLTSQAHAFFAFNCMFQIIKNRGCLMPEKQLFDHFGFIFSLIEANIDYLEDNRNILYHACKSLAIVLRLFFENNNSESIETTMGKINELEEAGGKSTVISLFLYISVLDVMNEYVPSIDIFTANQTRNNFISSVLPNFLSSALEHVKDEDLSIFKAAVQLLIQCYKFPTKDNAENFDLLNYPTCFNTIYEGPDFFEVLAARCAVAYEDQELNEMIFTLMEYFLRASNSNFPGLEAMIQCFVLATEKFKEILPSFGAEYPFTINVIRCLIVVAYQIKKLSMETQDLLDFFNVLMEFTEQALGSTLEAYQYIVKLWGYVSFWSPPIDMTRAEFNKKVRKGELHYDHVCENTKAFFSSILTVFQNYIMQAFSMIESSPLESIELLEREGTSALGPIWGLCKTNYDEFNAFLLETLENKKNEFIENPSEELIADMYYIILLINARHQGIKDMQKILDKIDCSNEEEKYQDIIIDFIIATNSTVESLAPAYGESFAKLEKLIISFIADYQSTHFKDTPMHPQSENELDGYILRPDSDDDEGKISGEMEKLRKENQQKKEKFDRFVLIVHSLIDRLYIDFNTFTQYKGVSELLVQDLMIIEQIVKKDKIREYVMQTEYVRNLYTRQINIDYDETKIDDLKRPRSRVYYMYAELMPNRRELLVFLASFDERFKTVLSSPSGQDIHVYTLFRDLHGVFRGLTEKSFLEKFITWFSNTHIDDATTLISSYATNIYVVRAITQLWIAFYISSKSMNSHDILTGTGIGIALFRSSLKLAEAIAQNCAEHEDQIHLFFKLICTCLTCHVANYGIMKHYGDNSADVLLQQFFNVFMEFPFEFATRKKSVHELILNSCISIIDNNKDEILPKKERFEAMMHFVVFTLQKFDETTWKLASSVMQKLIKYTEEAQVADYIQYFRPPVIIILDALINAQARYAQDAVELIDVMERIDGDFIKQTGEFLVNSYDEEFKGTISEAFGILMNHGDDDRATKFSRIMRKYSLNFKTSQIFGQFYE